MSALRSARRADDLTRTALPVLVVGLVVGAVACGGGSSGSSAAKADAETTTSTTTAKVVKLQEPLVTAIIPAAGKTLELDYPQTVTAKATPAQGPCLVTGKASTVWASQFDAPDKSSYFVIENLSKAASAADAQAFLQAWDHAASPCHWANQGSTINFTSVRDPAAEAALKSAFPTSLGARIRAESVTFTDGSSLQGYRIGLVSGDQVFWAVSYGIDQAHSIAIAKLETSKS